MLAQAFALYRRRFATLVFTAAFAIAPASLLEGGALKAGLSRMAFEAGPSPQKEPRPEGDSAKLQQFPSPQIGPAHPAEAIRALLPLLYETFLGVLLLAAGAWLALAALTPFA